MKLSEGVEWGMHCVGLLSALPAGDSLSAARLAEFHGVPVAYLAKHLQALSRAGILETSQGPQGGYRLARPASEITALEVVEAIDGSAPAFRCSEIRQRGPTALPAAAYRMPCGIHRLMVQADQAWRAELRRVTIADLAAGAARDAPPETVEKFVQWYQEVSR